MAGALSAAATRAAQRDEAKGPAAALRLPDLPGSPSLPGAVFFGFDDAAFPFRHHVQTHLSTPARQRFVLGPGPAGAHDEGVLYYGTVIRFGGQFHLWYNGFPGGPATDLNLSVNHTHLCYATSEDGVAWDKPALDLVAFKGSTRNNIVDLGIPTLWSSGAVLHDPEAADDRRFKIAVEARTPRGIRLCVAFSRDGLRWRPSANNPVGPFLEMTGIVKRGGLYYVNGQGGLDAHRPRPARRLVTFVSEDFETWSPCGAVGLDRTGDLTGPSLGADAHQYEEIHLGAGLWDRGNVLLGIYGQYHGHPTGDRRLATIDLGLALSHDGVHYAEPIPGFRLIPAREQPGSSAGVGPALQQGQGMVNAGDETLYWYSLWRRLDGSGVRLASWPRDRLGRAVAFRGPTDPPPQVVSARVEPLSPGVGLRVNASGLGAHTRLKFSILDRGFRPMPGFSGADAATIAESGFDVPVRWRGRDTLPADAGPLRLAVAFDGLRPEDAALHAVYLGSPLE